MQKLSFTISLPLTIKLDGKRMTLTFGRAQSTIDVPQSTKSNSRLFLEKGRTIFDIILSTAQELVGGSGVEDAQFTAAHLYHLAAMRYPYIKRNSMTAHVIASAPNHSSYHHYGVRKDYFEYLGDGKYKLKPRYVRGEINGENER